VEHFFSHFKDLGPWAVTAVGGLILRSLGGLLKELRSWRETAIKADLSFEEVSTREPEFKRRYETWLAHR
jgi:hypothetical protein